MRHMSSKKIDDSICRRGAVQFRVRWQSTGTLNKGRGIRCGANSRNSIGDSKRNFSLPCHVRKIGKILYIYMTPLVSTTAIKWVWQWITSRSANSLDKTRKQSNRHLNRRWLLWFLLKSCCWHVYLCVWQLYIIYISSFTMMEGELFVWKLS